MNKDEDKNLKQALFTVSDAVLGAAILLAAGMYLGSWLDQKFNCAPWLSVGLSLLGGAIGLIRMVNKASSLDIKSGSAPTTIKTMPRAKKDLADNKSPEAGQAGSGLVQKSAYEKWSDEEN